MNSLEVLVGDLTINEVARMTGHNVAEIAERIMGGRVVTPQKTKPKAEKQQLPELEAGIMKFLRKRNSSATMEDILGDSKMSGLEEGKAQKALAALQKLNLVKAFSRHGKRRFAALKSN